MACFTALEDVDLLAADQGGTFGTLYVRGDPDRPVSFRAGIPLLPPVAADDPLVLVIPSPATGL